MATKRFVFLLTLLVLFNAPLVTADFTPAEEISISFEGSYENWIETSAYQPKAIYESGTFHMFYTSESNGVQKIGYAQSIDGVNWMRNRLYDFDLTESVHSPSIFRNGNTYILTFAADTSPRSIMSVESNVVDSFSKNNLTLLIQGETAPSSEAISDPNQFVSNESQFLWYVSNKGSGWYLSLAYLENNEWKKCANNPISSVKDLGSPASITYNSKNYVFFHSPSGIEYMETADELSCNSVWSEKKPILTSSVYFPFPLLVDNEMHLYYNLFTLDAREIKRSTIVKSLYKTPLILVPGLFASWNKNAILHNVSVNQQDWKINNAVTEYTGLEKTLQNLGYQKNIDFFIFAYDWRKPLEKSADDLVQFIKSKSTPQSGSWYIVGHSLGGLIGKIAAQKSLDIPIKKLITVGSPHLGAAQTYKPLSGGEIDRENSLLWLTQKILLALYKTPLEPDRITIKKSFPSLSDLIPIYDFLVDQKNNFIPFQSLTLQNPTLSNYLLLPNNLSTVFTAISGLSLDTPFALKIKPQSKINRISGNYSDGQPYKIIDKPGDGTVLFTSSSHLNTNNNVTLLNANHGEIIYSKPSIKTILDALNLSYLDSQVVEGKETKISPSLIFFIRSAGEMEVSYNSTLIQESDGMIFIPDAKTGLYELKVKGVKRGPYKITVGQISDTEDLWETFEGKITSSNPSQEVDSYPITFRTPHHISVLTPTPTHTPKLTPCRPHASQKPKPTQEPKRKPNTTPKYTIPFYPLHNGCNNSIYSKIMCWLKYR